MAKEPAEIDKIPYDAPLSIAEPTSSWVTKQNKIGANGKRYTAADVPPKDLTGKWMIITGSNNGIGREAALAFAKMGANMILGCRDPPPHETHPTTVVEECLQAAKAAKQVIEVEWWPIDMANLASVEAFAKRWLDTGRTLNILCNNAGMGSSPGNDEVFLTKDGFEIIHQVNFLSHVLLTLSLLPALAKAPEPRIVCTTSCFHFLGKYDISNFNGGKGLGRIGGVQYYQNNKLYFQIWLTELQHRLLQHEQYKHITVNGSHPGYVNSGIWNIAGSGGWWKSYFMKCFAWMLGIDPQQGSMGMIYVATAPECGPDPKTQGVGTSEGKGGGRYFSRIQELEAMPHCRDRDARLRVWRKVNDELKLKDKGLLDVVGLWSTE